MIRLSPFQQLALLSCAFFIQLTLSPSFLLRVPSLAVLTVLTILPPLSFQILLTMLPTCFVTVQVSRDCFCTSVYMCVKGTAFVY